jgi:hypothetical protein
MVYLYANLFVLGFYFGSPPSSFLFEILNEFLYLSWWGKFGLI